jgi:recombination protein RecT
MTKALVTKTRTIRELIESADVQEQLKRGVASHVKIDQLARVWFSTVRSSSKLLSCTQHSLLSCLFAFGQLGLSPEPFLGQAYMVPYKDQATFIPGYRGLVTLWRRAGDGYNLAAKPVYKGDDFQYDFIQWELGNYHSFKHTPCETEKDRGGLRGAWAIFHYKDGRPMFDFLPMVDIEKRKKASAAKNSGPWVDWPEEMAVKTVIKHGLKLAPASVEDNTIAKAAYAEDLALSGEDQSRLFMPDADDRIIDVSLRNWKKEFDAEFEDISQDPLIGEYMVELSKAHKVALVEVERGAVESPDKFRSTFEECKKQMGATQKKPEGSSKRKTKKSAPKGKQKGLEDESLDDLMKTEAWGIMSGLKKDNEELYARVTGGNDPRTEKEVESVIDQMNAEMGEEGVPGA